MTMSRKQRQIAERHELFLQIGERILHDEGFHMLSMERIAELAEYSKGTVYQHFSCKEEILIQLCNQSLGQMLERFTTAANLKGSSRDRMVAIFYAHHLCEFMGECKKEHEMLQHLTMHGVKEKVTPESLQQHDHLEQSLLGIVKNIVDQAIDAGDLAKNKQMSSIEIVFGLWSLSTGGQLLQSADLPLQEFGITNPLLTLLQTQSLVLDGLNWRPLHNEGEFRKLLKRLETEMQS